VAVVALVPCAATNLRAEIGQGHRGVGSIEEGKNMDVVSLCCDAGCTSDSDEKWRMFRFLGSNFAPICGLYKGSLLLRSTRALESSVSDGLDLCR
jgi:hypothetical protein